MTDPPLLGFAAFSGAGKTTLLTRLIPLLRQEGLRVALIKHAHHRFDIDHPGKDSYELRLAGANPVMVVSRKRRAIIHETPDMDRDVRLADQLEYLPKSNLDLILVEGFKHETFPKIELHRRSMNKPLLFPDDPHIIALACDFPPVVPCTLPLFDLNQPQQIVDFILNDFLTR